MKYRVCCLIVFLFGVSGLSQSIDLSGTVTQSAGGTALAGVGVTLRNHSGVTTTSGTDGTYHLTSTAVARLESGLKVISGCSLSGNFLEFDATGTAPVSVELFNASGSKIKELTNGSILAPGNYRLDLGALRLAPTLYIIRYRQGSVAREYQYVPTGAGLQATGSLGGASASTSLLKRTDAAVDTLLFTLSGFSAAKVPITSYTGQYDAALQVETVPAGMKSIPGGTFTLGSDTNLDYYASPPHQVTISAFYMDSTLVTQLDYKTLMNGANPSPVKDFGDNMPVIGETWFDAALYCNARSKRDGLDTVYSYSSITGNPGWGTSAMADLNIDYTKKGYRMPNEAQWEYACRAGATTTYYWGNVLDGDYCWYYVNSGGGPHPVATKLPNKWGLYDMSGNLWEWCNDWWAEYYPDSAQTDPIGPAVPGTEPPAFLTGGPLIPSRVVRGGVWGPNDDSIDFMRCSLRSFQQPYLTNLNYGIRVVRPK